VIGAHFFCAANKEVKSSAPARAVAFASQTRRMYVRK